MNKLKKKSIELARELLANGRQLDLVKYITGVTIVEMVRQELAYEVIIPDLIRPGQFIHTGCFRPALDG